MASGACDLLLAGNRTHSSRRRLISLAALIGPIKAPPEECLAEQQTNKRSLHSGFCFCFCFCFLPRLPLRLRLPLPLRLLGVASLGPGEHSNGNVNDNRARQTSAQNGQSFYRCPIQFITEPTFCCSRVSRGREKTNKRGINVVLYYYYYLCLIVNSGARRQTRVGSRDSAPVLGLCAEQQI